MAENSSKAAELLHLYRNPPDSVQAFVTEAYRLSVLALKENFPGIPFDQGFISALRAVLPGILWPDLKRLQSLRNQVVHEDYTPHDMDRQITHFTVRCLLTFLRGVAPDTHSEEVPRRSRSQWREFQDLAKGFFERYLDIPLRVEVERVLADGQRHRFDLASPDGSILIECKSYTWTVSGNEPSAKLNHAKTDAQLLKSSSAIRKILVFQDDLRKKDDKSLAELFVRRNRGWLGDLEVWRFRGAFGRLWPE